MKHMLRVREQVSPKHSSKAGLDEDLLSMVHELSQVRTYVRPFVASQINYKFITIAATNKNAADNHSAPKQKCSKQRQQLIISKHCGLHSSYPVTAVAIH